VEPGQIQRGTWAEREGSQGRNKEPRLKYREAKAETVEPGAENRRGQRLRSQVRYRGNGGGVQKGAGAETEMNRGRDRKKLGQRQKVAGAETERSRGRDKKGARGETK
jgi:hypothetical protein